MPNTHDRRVSDALHHHRIFDTMMMSTHPLPLTSYLSPLTSPLCTIFVVFDILFGKLFVFLWKLSFLKEKNNK